ncbi:hypothetical protein BASA50_002563 [Batrachochytrium salamandrivorans]|uniref:Glycosyltransferase 2-like domain-containing protein n=1 Tax=Batrachochytrium salamandrivorans TaxID=1357716 RepID=A0ABQ8FKY9_9FUNG|nr:hypothetical protein BASA60_008369 [Batrachochytrium salamandrivorans]KAH6579003.1 hypothetical protein BASA61_010532 [Batrachochytrium salamandrivorans]KAH6600104.1 hypothetical protein BASA50_002563 [Batrachochytrium salamandrivorans]KAJ1330573.1 hypothetical protein BSLG_009335 [Batrachochytrium salamandrivorans]
MRYTLFVSDRQLSWARTSAILLLAVVMGLVSSVESVAVNTHKMRYQPIAGEIFDQAHGGPNLQQSYSHHRRDTASTMALSSTPVSSASSTMLTSRPRLLANVPDIVQILLGTLCFVGVLQALIYTFMLAVKILAAKRLHEHIMTKWTTYSRKTVLAVLLVAIRVGFAVPMLVIIFDWTSLVDPNILQWIMNLYLWIFASAVAVTALLHTLSFLAASSRQLFYLPHRNMASEKRMRLQDAQLPDVYVVLTVGPQPAHIFNRTLKAVLHSDYPGRRLYIIVVFHPNAKPCLNSRLLNALGIHAMAQERPYTTLIDDDAKLICFWSRSTHHRDMQRQALFIIQTQARHAPSRLQNSIVLLSDSSALFHPDTIMRGVSVLSSSAGCVAVSGWTAAASHEEWESRSKRSWVVDLEALKNALFQLPLDNALGVTSHLCPSAVFVRFFALKAIERQYFATSVIYSIHDLHLVYADWSAYFATSLIERFGPKCIGFSFLIKPLIPGDSKIHTNPAHIQSHWSRVANQTSYLVFSPHTFTSPLLTLRTILALVTEHTSISALTIIVVCLASGIIPIIPLICIGAAVGIKWILTMTWSTMRGRPALGIYSIFYVLVARPSIMICILISSFLTWMVRFDIRAEKQALNIIPVTMKTTTSPSTPRTNALAISPTLTRTSNSAFSALVKNVQVSKPSDIAMLNSTSYGAHLVSNKTNQRTSKNEVSKTPQFMLQNAHRNNRELIKPSTDAANSPSFPRQVTAMASLQRNQSRRIGVSLNSSSFLIGPSNISIASISRISETDEDEDEDDIYSQSIDQINIPIDNQQCIPSEVTNKSKEPSSNLTLCTKEEAPMDITSHRHNKQHTPSFSINTKHGNRIHPNTPETFSPVNQSIYNSTTTSPTDYSERQLESSQQKPITVPQSLYKTSSHNTIKARQEFIQKQSNARLYAPVNRSLRLDVPAKRWQQLKLKPIDAQSVSVDWRHALWTNTPSK